MITHEEAVKLLCSAGLRMTKPREWLLRLVLNSTTPFSVKSLHERAEQAGLEIHLATVHRNLAEFAEIGIVDKLPGEDNCLFTLHRQQDNGAHVFCLDCRNVVALEGMSFQNPEEMESLFRALMEQGFDASTVRLMLAAHCNSQNARQRSVQACSGADEASECCK